MYKQWSMMFQVREIGWDKMNGGDCFILDVGEILFVWNGTQSNLTERRKVCLHLIQISPGGRGGRCQGMEW